MDLKAKQVPAAQAPVQAPLQPQLPYPPSPRGVQGGWEEGSQLAQEDMLSIAASGEGTSFFSDMQVGETPACSLGSQCPRPVVQLSFGTYRTCCSFPTGPLDASGRTTPVRFPDAGNGFSPSEVPGFPTLHGVLKQAALLVSLEGADKLGLARFPQVDSTIAALVKALPVGGLAREPACSNPQCKGTETHLKRAYAAEARATRLSNTTSVLTATWTVYCARPRSLRR
ncbi:UNVERIFIED_CONTAM: hypothetical protein FKN15_048084 [Acipenser sinensis]